MLKQLLSDSESKFADSLDYLRKELSLFRSSQTSPALVEDIPVPAYNDNFPIKELAAISVPEPSIILIQPWDQTIIQNIESALTNSDLGINPITDGLNLRLNIPTLSKEKRQELIKKVGAKCEEVKVSIRTIRQDKMKALDNMLNEKLISENERDQSRKEVQEKVDTANKEVEKIKEKKVAALDNI